MKSVKSGEGGDKAQLTEYYRRHKVSKYLTELLLKAVVTTSVFYYGGPEAVRTLKDPEEMSGLISGAMLAPRLCYPDESTGSLTYKSAQAGNWLAYDFNRALEFPSAKNRSDFTQLTKGKLFGCLVDDLKDQPADERTPVGKLNMFDVNHALSFNSYTANELVDEGMLIATTHRQAYESVGMTSYIDELEARSVADDIVYQVTPKGNTLLRLIPEQGAPRPKRLPETSREAVPIFST